MAINQTRLHLLAYDIADPKRLQQVHRAVRRAGIPLQYSVFLIPGRAADVEYLLRELDQLIEAREDDIRVYPLPNRLSVDRYGRQQLPQGLDLISGDHLHDSLLLLIGTPETPLPGDDGDPA